MALLSYDRLNSLEKSRSDWKIKDSVTRMWPTVAPDNKTTKGFNLILLDNDVRFWFVGIFISNRILITYVS